MITSEIFYGLSNLLGTNFSHILVPKLWIFISQIIFFAFGFNRILYYKILRFEEYKKDIFFILDAFQIELLYFLQIYFVFRAIQLRVLQKEILDDIKSTKHKIEGSGRNFLIYFGIIIATRAIKLSISTTESGRNYMSKVLFAELIFSSSDFMFEFYLSMLVEHLNFIESSLLTKKSSSIF